MEYRYTAFKYSGGTLCGNGLFETLDDCMNYADDGFCDYVRVQNQTTWQVLKIHFDPTPHDDDWYETHTY